MVENQTYVSSSRNKAGMDLQIFVSSQLRRRTLKEERELVRKVIEEKCPGFV